jgi:hypothetical protein
MHFSFAPYKPQVLSYSLFTMLSSLYFHTFLLAILIANICLKMIRVDLCSKSFHRIILLIYYNKKCSPSFVLETVSMSEMPICDWGKYDFVLILALLLISS